jgi:hypothetical protein
MGWIAGSTGDVEVTAYYEYGGVMHTDVVAPGQTVTRIYSAASQQDVTFVGLS